MATTSLAKIKPARLETIKLCYELVAIRHLSYRQAAEVLRQEHNTSITHTTVATNVKIAKELITIPDIKQLQQYEYDRLMYLDRMLDEKIARGYVPAIRESVVISESRRKLLGLDKPQKIQMEHSVVPTNPENELRDLANELGFKEFNIIEGEIVSPYELGE